MTPPVVNRKSGVVVPKPLVWHRRALASVAAVVFWLFVKSWRHHPDVITLGGAEAEISGPVIYCLWHNQLAIVLSCTSRPKIARWNAGGLAALISASGDGALLSVVMKKVGVASVRGSSSRRGPQALLEATRQLRKNISIAITPDGPRGPAYQIQDGILYLAQLSGRPIIPLANFTTWKARLRSWDRFQIPFPFAKCELSVGGPIWVPKNASDAEREQCRQQLAEAMRAITRE